MARQTNPKLLADFFNKIGAKRTFHRPCLQNRIYEYAP
jgi:hypothetical protein